MAGLVPYAGAERSAPATAPRPRRDARPRWSPERVVRVKEMIAQGLTSKECAEVLGTSRNAVLGVIYRDRQRQPRQIAEEIPGASSGVLRTIVEHVASVFAVTPAEMLSRRADLRVSEPRKIAIYLCRTRGGATTGQLRKLFSRTESTICAATQETERRLEAPIIREAMERIERGLEAALPPLITTEKETDQ